MSNFIPPMTDPRGRYWSQPPATAITIDDTHALLSHATINALMEYSTSTPSGVYPGKMWKCQHEGRWYLRWYGIVPGNDSVCSNNWREILLA